MYTLILYYKQITEWQIDTNQHINSWANEHKFPTNKMVLSGNNKSINYKLSQSTKQKCYHK